MSNLNGDLDDTGVVGVSVGVGIPLLVLICVILICVPLVCVCCCRRHNKNHIPEASPEREFQQLHACTCLQQYSDVCSCTLSLLFQPLYVINSNGLV